MTSLAFTTNYNQPQFMHVHFHVLFLLLSFVFSYNYSMEPPRKDLLFCPLEILAKIHPPFQHRTRTYFNFSSITTCWFLHKIIWMLLMDFYFYLRRGNVIASFNCSASVRYENLQEKIYPCVKTSMILQSVTSST